MFLLFLHKLWPVVSDNIIAYIVIKICHCVAHKTHFVPLWRRGDFAQRLGQITNCPLLYDGFGHDKDITTSQIDFWYFKGVFWTGLEASQQQYYQHECWKNLFAKQIYQNIIFRIIFTFVLNPISNEMLDFIPAIISENSHGHKKWIYSEDM